MIGLSAKLPGTRSGAVGAFGAAAGAAGAGAPSRWHAATAIANPAAISAGAQQLDRNGLLSRRCIVESRSRPTAMLLFSTALSGYRAFRNTATRVTIANTMAPPS